MNNVNERKYTYVFEIEKSISGCVRKVVHPFCNPENHSIFTHLYVF